MTDIDRHSSIAVLYLFRFHVLFWATKLAWLSVNYLSAGYRGACCVVNVLSVQIVHGM